MNPFEGDLKRIRACRDGHTCPYQPADFCRFGNAPAVLPLTQVQGGVVVIAGCAGHGKSVYGHRLLHEYRQKGLAPVDLHGSAPYRACIARRAQVLRKLSSRNGLLDADDVADEKADDTHWPARLQTVLGQTGEEMVVRLPRIEPEASDAGTRNIAWEIACYANAAEESKSVIIYEYNATDWPRDWESLRSAIDQNYDANVRACVLDPVAPADLWAYAQGVMDRSPHQRFTMEEGVPEWLRRLFGTFSVSPTKAHDLMRRVFANAIAAQSTKVTLEHLMPEVLEPAAWSGAA
ncbi:hypothetical protein GCM10022254_33290 [Actinomadura meridiana]|uniref:ATP-binding protein n=1 Tax=Actinomadura meridiana TaxID=559626 RepID=A0ABP8C3G2_9ACTN